MTAAYYNEIDPYAAQWLRNLILQGHLPRGDVDARSISELHSDDSKASPNVTSSPESADGPSPPNGTLAGR